MCLDPLWDRADWPPFKQRSSTKHFSVKFQTTLNQIHEESEGPRDICIDQGFTFTHTPLLSLAVIQGLFGLASNSCSAVGGFKHTQGRISNETPRTSQHPLSLTFLVLQTGLHYFNNNSRKQQVITIPVNMYAFAKELHNSDHVMGSSFLFRQIFTLTWCFQCWKSPPSKAFSFILWAISLSSTGTLILLADSFLPHDRGSAHPSSHEVLLSSDLLVSLLLFSGSHTRHDFFLPVITARRSVSLTLISSISLCTARSSCHLCLLTVCVCLYTCSSSWFALCDMIKSGLSFSREAD